MSCNYIPIIFADLYSDTTFHLSWLLNFDCVVITIQFTFSSKALQFSKDPNILTFFHDYRMENSQIIISNESCQTKQIFGVQTIDVKCEKYASRFKRKIVVSNRRINVLRRRQFALFKILPDIYLLADFTSYFFIPELNIPSRSLLVGNESNVLFQMHAKAKTGALTLGIKQELYGIPNKDCKFTKSK